MRSCWLNPLNNVSVDRYGEDGQVNNFTIRWCGKRRGLLDQAGMT